MKVLLCCALLLLPSVFGRGSFLPLDVVVNNEKERSLQGCPPPLDLLCDPPPIDPVEWQACAAACTDALCCQGPCQEPCFQSCATYTPCLGLGTGPPTPPPEEETCSVLSVDYYQGYNLHFPVQKSYAESLMPFSCFSPLKLAVDDRKEKDDKKGRRKRRGHYRNDDDEDEGFFVSFYVASIGVEFGGMQVQTGRADLFTYAIDPQGDPSLVFIAAFVEVPAFIQLDPMLLENFKGAIEGFATDSTTGEVAYPHLYASTFQVKDDGFVINDIEGMVGKSVEIDIGRRCNAQLTRFPIDFVLGKSWRICSTRV